MREVSLGILTPRSVVLFAIDRRKTGIRKKKDCVHNMKS
jgi:hypothetical protein